MNVVDVVIVLLAVGLAALGWERGLIASALSLGGFLGGAALGARLGPELLSDGASSPYAPLVSVLLGVLTGAFLAISLGGVGAALRTRLGRTVAIRAVDGAGGAALLAALALLVAWGFGAIALHTTSHGSRELRETVQRSAILSELNEHLPPSGPLLQVLRRVDPRRSVRGPEADVARPTPATRRSRSRAAAKSTPKRSTTTRETTSRCSAPRD